MSKNTILITGIPRSGTSLVTKLISMQENTICFSEPIWLRDIRHDKQTTEEFSNKLKEKVEFIRGEIKKGNPVELTVKRGSKELPDNYYHRSKNSIINLKHTIKVFVEYTHDLKICIKSNALFTACLSSLKENNTWDIVTVIRDPLYILLSWKSLDIPISKGKIMIGEIYSKKVREIVKEPDLIIRQIKILDWFFMQYSVNKAKIIKYEDIVLTPQDIIENILNRKSHVDAAFSSSNNINRYKSKELKRLIYKLRQHSVYKNLYYKDHK